MPESPAAKRRIDWRLPLLTAVCSFLIVLLIAISKFFDPGMLEILYCLICAPLIGLLLAILAIARRSLTVLAMLVVFGMVSYLSLRHFDDLRTKGRWMLLSRTYESQLLNQPSPANGDLRHMEWDGWGFVGAGETTVYLVYDPSDSLQAMTGIRRTQKPRGVPCAVYSISRLEQHWYSVQFFADTGWDSCN